MMRLPPVLLLFFSGTQLPQLPFGRDADLIKRMLVDLPPLPFPEMPMIHLARKFREGWASEEEARSPEEILNFRREAQAYTVSLLGTWVAEGVLEINALELSAGDLIQSSKGTQSRAGWKTRRLPTFPTENNRATAKAVDNGCGHVILAYKSDFSVVNTRWSSWNFLPLSSRANKDRVTAEHTAHFHERKIFCFQLFGYLSYIIRGGV
jgi:hypothetical protein